MSSRSQDGLAVTSDTVGTPTQSRDAADRWDCKLRKLELVNNATGEVRRLDCKAWSCMEHGPRLAWRWRTRVSMVPWALMLTLTLVPEDRRKARVAWAKMRGFLKARGMITYLRVMELGPKGGMRHWHVLVDCTFVDQGELSTYCASVGLGSVVWVSGVKDREGAVSYLLGYVFKSLGVTDERQEGWRKLTVSRNIPSWPKVLAARHDTREDSDRGRWFLAVGDFRHMPRGLSYADWLKAGKEAFENADKSGAVCGSGAAGEQV